MASETSAASAGVLLWDDNPALTDLLGFDAVADAIVEALKVRDLDPVTIAIQSPWGGGKSTALALLHERLRSQPGVIVVPVDPWEFDDDPDVRGTLIAAILGAIQREAPTEGAKDRFLGLLKRIAWARVGSVVAKAVVTANVDIEGLVTALTPKPAEEAPMSMAGFRDAFDEVMAEMTEVTRVVVLVDDLDRCLPPAVTQTLEAIKLFLSVKKMAFVLAADQSLVREAIAASVDASGRSAFADRYLEKIVQLPITLPRLSRDDTETYIALLLAARRANKVESYEALLEHVRTRRASGSTPYLNAPYPAGAHEPSKDDLRLASQLAQVLAGDRWSNPRAIKRFLNAWGVRNAVAVSRGVRIDPQVVLKLFLLEERHPDDFKVLVELPAVPRRGLLATWERWGREEADVDKPKEVSDESQAWAGTDPRLADVAEELDAYLSLAATFTAFSTGGSLSDQEMLLVGRLAHEAQTVREQAVEAVLGLDLAVQRSIVTTLLSRLSRVERPTEAIESLAAIAATVPALSKEIAGGLRVHAFPLLEPADVATIAQSESAEVKGLLREISESDVVPQGISDVACDLLNDPGQV